MNGSQNRTWGVLTLVGFAGAACSLPLALDLQASIISDSGVPTTVIVAAGLVQSAVLVALVTAIGVWLGPQAGFSPPQQRLDRPAVLIGAATGAALVLADKLVFASHMPDAVEDFAAIATWKRYLASFYGGFTEELLLRFGLLTVLLWLGTRLLKRKPAPSNVMFWSLNAFVAVAFGLAHLPATQLLTELTPLVVARAIVLNGAAGLLFGWLYRQRGIEAAFAAHFAADISLQTGVTLLF